MSEKTIHLTFVRDVHAVRSGRGAHEGEVYAWNDSEGVWATVPEGDGDGA